MILGFDARLMSVPGGIGRYCRELLLQLSNTIEHKLVVVVKEIPADFPRRPNIEWVETDIHWYGLREQLTLGGLMNSRRDVQLWHIPHWNVPITLSRPFVMTFHDFIFEEYPTHNGTLVGRTTFFIKWTVWRLLLVLNLRRARAVITVSAYVRDLIVHRFPFVASKLHVIHNGVSPIPPGPAHDDQPYFLMVGNSYPHKNHAVVLKALAAHPEITAKLIIATHRDRFSEALAENATYDTRVKFVFDCSDAELASLYRGATALIFPSLSEGFGIPPLEAFSCGTPVIAARTSCLPEILDNLPLWIAPDDSEALATHMRTLLTAPKSTPEPLIAHARIYTWQTAALSTQKIYESVLY